MKRQAEGTSAQHAERTAAYKMRETAHYTCQSALYTTDDFISAHQRGYNKVAQTGIILNEARRVDQFLKVITDPALQGAKFAVLGDVTKLENFEQCQLYIKTVHQN
jgi:curli biogenesis system outer membrane secretion channel CsgG